MTVERHLAARIRSEREANDWTLDRLAQKMTDAGCPMDRSAIHRIESGTPPRRITIDEAVVFAGVLEVPLEDLILHPAIAKGRAAKLYRQWLKMLTQYERIGDQLRTLEGKLLAILKEGYSQDVDEALRGQPLPTDDAMRIFRLIHGMPHSPGSRWVIRGEDDARWLRLDWHDPLSAREDHDDA